MSNTKAFLLFVGALIGSLVIINSGCTMVDSSVKVPVRYVKQGETARLTTHSKPSVQVKGDTNFTLPSELTKTEFRSEGMLPLRVSVEHPNNGILVTGSKMTLVITRLNEKKDVFLNNANMLLSFRSSDVQNNPNMMFARGSEDVVDAHWITAKTGPGFQGRLSHLNTVNLDIDPKVLKLARNECAVLTLTELEITNEHKRDMRTQTIDTNLIWTICQK